jgi:hypothetical protein
MSGPNDEPSWEEVITTAIQAALFNLHTGLPAKIVSYDPSKQSATVQPCLKRVFVDPTDDTKTITLTPPPITNVPVSFPAGGGWSLTWQFAAGDVVYLGFSERSIDRWLEAPPGQNVDPLDSRRFHLSDAVAIASIRQRTDPLAGAARGGMRLGRDDGSTEIQIFEDGTILVKGERVLLAGEAGAPVARAGDPVLVNDPAFIAWATAVGSNPLVGVPFPGASGVAAVVQSGSTKVSAE